MEKTNLLNLVKANFDQYSEPAESYITPLPDLILIRHFSPTEFDSVIYEPVICLILQGKKETTIHGRTIEIRAGESLLISHDLTVSARITEASKELPYVALVLKINLDMLRSLHESIESFDTNEDEASSFAFDTIDDDISETLERYLKLTENPQECENSWTANAKRTPLQASDGPAGLYVAPSHVAQQSREQYLQGDQNHSRKLQTTACYPGNRKICRDGHLFVPHTFQINYRNHTTSVPERIKVDRSETDADRRTSLGFESCVRSGL